MLSAPEDGWTFFRLGTQSSYRLSFLTDVACEWLTQAIHGLKTMDVFSVHGFSEPGRVICTVSYWSCYIIFEDDGPAPICDDINHLHVNMIDFCRKLHHDIDSNLDGWVNWSEDYLECGAEEQTEECMKEAARKREKKLRDMLDELKKLIDERAGDFEEGCFF